jgi:cold shock CspA family protein
MRRVQMTVAVLLIVVCTLAFMGCRSLTGRSVGQQIDDKVISTQVKTKLSAERAGNLISTGVGTQYGVVRLTGTVHTPEQKSEAERIASRVAGVRGVKNEIVVVPVHRETAKVPSGTPAASPATTQPPALTGQVTAVNPTSGDVTIKTEAGEDVMLRVPASTAAQLEQGQKISISAGSVK